ncbi:MAG: Conserved putative secreted protein [Amycolatopsis sp.]|jgi:V8-like Glu-specific endopeptidase|uniref:S1 family peptidase n=1 Tax=Amycolatopsis sp. TaxID=37632 RepID=UPI00261288B7|nr:serine protease [Amycolatopsis sp.]MCU1684951.1 Conserved putative secreted protein [Amycolatopsis sp.]
MTRRLLGTLFAGLTVTLALGTAPTAFAATAAPTVTSFAGTVALSDCSGSVVKLAGGADTDPALVLSNGHCLESGFPAAGQVIVNKPSTRTFSLLSPNGKSSLGTLRANKIAYATMTNTDVSLYQLTTTYAKIKQTYGISPLEISPDHPAAGHHIDVVSGYWRKVYSCSIDGFVYQLHEGDWTWKDSIRYTPECQTIGGTSGSPIVDTASGKLVGINNTGNEDGASCTLNNPCEVAQDGTVTVHQGTNYGEETYLFYGCLKPGNVVDLTNPACALPKPAA